MFSYGSGRSANRRRPNKALHQTAASPRFLLNMNLRGLAAAAEAGR